MIGDICLVVTVNGKKYESVELLSKGHFIMTKDTLTISNDVFEQLYRMMRRICDQCYREEILCKI